MCAEGHDRVVVLSDIHFGDPGSTLGATEPDGSNSAATKAASLMAAIREGGDVSELVLLGDIFEMWTASFEQAVAAARPFLDALVSLNPQRIVYVPGNHDYHLLVQHREAALRRALRQGVPPPWPTSIQQTFEDSHLSGLLPEPLRDRLVVTYPNYSRDIGGQRFVFHHGHHLATIRGGDMFALGPRFVLEHLERIRVQDLSLQALERGSHVFFEMTHSLGLSSGARERVVRFWGRLLMTRHMIQGLRSFLSVTFGRVGLASNRGTAFWDVSNFRQPARRYLTLMAEETGDDFWPDVLVFGHTHRQGVAAVSPAAGATELVTEALQGDLQPMRQRDGGCHDFHLVNTGCWCRESEKRNEGHVDIVTVIEPDALSISRFVDSTLEVVGRHSLAPPPSGNEPHVQ